MATKMALGTTDMSGVYLGTTEIKKAYLGTNKVYEKISEIYFDTLISPTTWTEVTAKKEYTATNTLGTWVIKAEDSYNTTVIPSKAFDNVSNDYFRTQTLADTSTYTYLELDTPVSIKPISIKIRQRFCGSEANPSYLQAYNENTSTWDTLGTLTRATATGGTDNDFTLSGDTYYKKFRVYLSAYGTSAQQRTPYIFLFNITEGYYKP